MEVIFICGCLEPGKDGVGDYTRRLAGELTRQGVKTGIISFNDGFIEGEKETEQNIDNINIRTLRISKKHKKTHKIKKAKKWIEKYNPSWVSLQLVPYSFQDKGLPYGLHRTLNKIGNSRNWHIMVHELWIGKLENSKFKNNVYRFLQKRIISKVLHFNKVKCIHTHLPSYKSSIEKVGVKVNPLALFSNINFEKSNDQELSKNIFTVAFFSQISNDKSILNFIQSLTVKLKESNKLLLIKLVGGNEKKNIEFKNDLLNKYSIEGDVVLTGFLNSIELSKELQNCDLGITPVPRHGLGKSGSVAAFISHKVPVVAPNILSGFNSSDIGFFDSKLAESIILTPNLKKLKQAKAILEEASIAIDLSEITKKFMLDLNLITI